MDIHSDTCALHSCQLMSEIVHLKWSMLLKVRKQHFESIDLEAIYTLENVQKRPKRSGIMF